MVIRVEKEFVANSYGKIRGSFVAIRVEKTRRKKTAKTLIKRNKRNKKILQANSLKRDA